jgi:FSR family fosmidomycin resistance protein-like MFS transporter
MVRMTMLFTARRKRPLAAESCALSGAHLLNDLIQSMIPAMYPLLKEGVRAGLRAIGLITLAFQVTRASLLSLCLGLVPDHKPLPYDHGAGQWGNTFGLLGPPPSLPHYAMCEGLRLP